MSSKFSCTYCGKYFSAKCSMLYHIKNAKTCISKRENQNNVSNVCDFCKKEYSTKGNLIAHLNKCNEKRINDICIEKEKENKKLIEENKKLIEENKKLEEIIKNIKSITINNTITLQNLQIITPEHLKEQSKNLTIEHIKQGALGYSNYFLEYPLKDRLLCTDFSRKKIKYKDEKGEIVTDPEMSKLSELLFQSIRDKNKELTIQYSNELSQKMNSAEISQIEYFMKLASKFSQQDLEVLRMFNGQKNDFFHDIVRNICCKTLEK